MPAFAWLIVILLGLAVAPAWSQTIDSFNPSPNDDVYTTVVEPDGDVLIGGAFSLISNQGRARIARVSETGLLDGLNPIANPYDVLCMLVQPDRKVVVGGAFNTVGGWTRMGIARLHADGSLDLAFNPGAMGTVYALLLLNDGKILLGGSFTTLAGRTRLRIGRIEADGSVDTNFTASSAGTLYSMALQENGQIVVGGAFTALDSQTRNRIGRLNADGTLDESFNPGASSNVLCVAIQPDGKILVGGVFTNLAGQAKNRLGRLNPDGSLDTSFAANVNNGTVNTIQLQADGKILIGGSFTTVQNQARLYLGRLNADGSLDTTFIATASAEVASLALQPDGKLVAGGLFTTLAGVGRSHIGRLTNAEPAIDDLSFDGANITWLRGGTSPEVSRASLDASTNGTDWFNLGTAGRVAGGFYLTIPALPQDSAIRARGFGSCGYCNGSAWFVERVIGRPILTMAPIAVTNGAGTAAAFTAYAGGTPPLSYQWLKNGLLLTNGGVISGAQTDKLKISYAYGADHGVYSVIVSNAIGTVTGQVATLRVNDPRIVTQPVGTTNSWGSTLTLTVLPQGSLPLTYQWLQGGTNLDDAGSIYGSRTSTLTVSNAFGGNSGSYFVVISNMFGAVTSSVASVKVRDPLILTNPVNRVVAPGDPFEFSVTAAGTMPLLYQWQRHGIDIPGATVAKLVLTNAWSDEGLFSVVVSNQFGSTNAAATLTISVATADPSWTSGGGGQTFALQPDGKIVFRPRSGNSIFRLNGDGTIDSGFDAPGFDPYYESVFCLGVQEDGKILVGGGFRIEPRRYLMRLNPNGSIDNTFNPALDGSVYCILPQGDGKILVGTYISGRGYFHRLHTNGVLDTTFSPLIDNQVYCAAIEGDGRIIVGGAFSTVAGQTRPHLARLQENGSLDNTFNATSGLEDPVYTLAIQPDGKVLSAPGFEFSPSYYQMKRYNSDGSRDTTFSGVNDNYVNALALQADGKIVVGGSFQSLGSPRTSIGRLNSNGSLDTTFNPGANDTVEALGAQADGNMIVSGYFSTLGGQPAPGLGRLKGEPAEQRLEVAGSMVNWFRFGTSPEVWRTRFAVSTNGTDWTFLGDGTRMGGGWQLTGISVVRPCVIRARGFASGGRYNGSSWFVESTLALNSIVQPRIISDDGGFGWHTNRFGFNCVGSDGQIILVEGSTNLVHWTPLSTNLGGGNPIYFSDPLVPDCSSRYYRLRLQ